VRGGVKEEKKTTERYTLADLEKWAETGGNVDPPIRLGVFGDPVAHSLSPQTQDAAVRACGIEMQYARFHIRANELRSALLLLPKLDFVGINVYRPNIYVEPSAAAPGYHSIPFSASHPKMKSEWHIFDPEVLYWGPHHVQSLWGAKSIYITENGCAASDELSENGRVYDSDRVMFLRAFLTQLQRATADGVPVKGYFHWSLMDNFEWIYGYGNRFGLVYVDFATQKRIPKASAAWFREASRQNAVV